MEQENYAFYVEDLRPVQLSRFNFEQYGEGRLEFGRDEWLDAVLRSVGLEPSKLSHRVKGRHSPPGAPGGSELQFYRTRSAAAPGSLIFSANFPLTPP